MDELTRLKSFLKSISPACKAIKTKLIPLQQALGHLYCLGDVEDPRPKLAAYGKAIRKAWGPQAKRLAYLEIIEAGCQPNLPKECRDILVDAIADKWGRFDDLVANYYQVTQSEILNNLHRLALAMNEQAEKRLTAVHADTIRQELSCYQLTAGQVASSIKGRVDCPPYLAAMLELLLDREAPFSSDDTHAAETRGIPMTNADSPSRWAKVFQCSWDTLKRRLKEGAIRHKKLSVKSYQIAIDDLPECEKSKHMPSNTRLPGQQN